MTPKPPNHDLWKPFVGKPMESFPDGKPDKVVETFDFKEESGGRYSTNGSHSGKNVYDVVGDKLVHEKGGVVDAKLNNGELLWSHGYRSRIVGSYGVRSKSTDLINEESNFELHTCHDLSFLRT